MRSNLTGETNWSADKRVYLVIVHHLSAISKLEPEFFFALLQENTLLNADSATRARFVINLQTELKPLIYDVALLDHKRDPQIGEPGYPAWHRIQRTGKRLDAILKPGRVHSMHLQWLIDDKNF